MFSLLLYLALTCCMFGSAFALSDLFSGSSDIAAAPSPFDESLWDTSDKSLLDFSDESLFGVVDESLFNVPDESLGDVSNESLSDPDILLSFCSNDGTGQPSKLRARDVVCPSNLLAPPTLQLEAPELPTITDIENAVTKKPQKDGPDRTVIKIISVNGLDMRTDDPKYYCAKFAEPSYTIPVCGSGSLMDRIDKMPPYYARIENSIKLVVPPYKSWMCVEFEFFCCVQWTRYPSPPLGTGYECVSLKEFGWDGYDTDTINVSGD